MKYVSLFSGIEAASVAWEPLGWEPLAFSEIDAFLCAVLAERFPGVPNLGDITKIDWKKAVKAYGKPDIVVGGSPCQAFSIAGLREGLKDPRGNLMLEWLRVVDEVKPEFALWENVPGVLSDKTGAFRTLLDSLQSLGYIIDMDILDAQYFGVAQRRKRVFVLGWRVETLLKKKTSTSRTITAQILGKILLDTLEGLSAESEKGHASSDCAGSSRDGLMKRMRSFGLHTEEDLLTWLKSLEGEKGRLALELKNLATRLGTKSRDTLDTEATSVFEKMEDERSFTELLWRTISAESSKKENASTISTSTSLTTRSRIFICSIAGLIIARLMSHWKKLDRVYCNEGLYISTLLKEFISYAIRENERVGLLNGFDDILAYIGREAERQEKIVRDFGNERGREIQLEPESLRWDSPSSKDKRKALAAGAGIGPKTAGWPVSAGFSYKASPSAGNIGYEPEHAPTVLAERNDAAVCIQGDIARGAHMGQNGKGWSDEGVSYTLDTMDVPAVTLKIRGGCDGGGKGPMVTEDMSCTLGCRNSPMCYGPQEPSPTLRASKDVPAVLDLTGGEAQAHRVYSSDGIAPSLRAHESGGNDLKVLCMAGQQPNSMVSDEVCGTLTAHEARGVDCMRDGIAFAANQRGEVRIQGGDGDVCGAIQASQSGKQVHGVTDGYAVRRLTPRECERLQGFQDDWTKIPYRGKPAEECPDTPRYKAIGNSMAVPVMRWIGERIELAERGV